MRRPVNSTLSRVATGVCVVAGVFVLAGIFHDPAIGEPWGWLVAFVLAAGVLAAAPLAFVVLVYLPRRVVRGPARSFRVLGDGAIGISAFAYPPMWARLRSLASAGAFVGGTGHFSLTVDSRGLDFRVGGRHGEEIAFVGWSSVRSVSPTVIVHRSRRLTGVSVTFLGTDKPPSLDFACAREGAIGVFGHQTQDELEELCRLISAQAPALGTSSLPGGS